MIHSVKRFGQPGHAAARRSIRGAAVAALLVALSLAIAPMAGATPKRVLRPSVTTRVVPLKPHRSGALRRVVPAGRRAIPLLSPNPARLREAKARAAARLGAGGGALLSPSRSAASPVPRAAVFGGLNEAGMFAGAKAPTPPDTTGAIGPSNYLEFVNGTGITAYSRSLAFVSGPVGLEDFVGYPSDFVFDPQIQWDQSWGRWIFAMDDIEFEYEEVEPGVYQVIAEYFYLDLGWSKSADPTNLSTGPGGGWCGYSIETSPVFDDYPKLGHGNNGIAIGTNVFSMETGEFLTARIWSIAKPPSPGTCPGTTGVAFGSPSTPLRTKDGGMAFTPVPANTADSSAASYVVAADYPEAGTANQIMGWHVSGGGEGATLVEDGNMNVGSFEIPASVPQPGTGYKIDSSDTRLTNAVAVTDPAVGQEAVWTQHTIEGSEGRSVVRWYELLPGTQTVRQEGTISDPTQFVFNGAISPTREGDAAAVDFNRGSATLFPDMHAQSRKASTPLDQMEGDVPLGTSAGAAQDFSCVDSPVGVCRWGDYAGASPDPSVGGVVWGSNQGLAAAGGSSDEEAHWTTRNFALFAQLDTTISSGPPNPTSDSTPTFAFSANEPSATFECKLDGGGFGACVSPLTTPVLGDGGHTFQVRATDGVNTDPTPASRTFTVDTAPPDTTIGFGPSSLTNDSTPAFAFSSSEPGSTFECAVDGGGFSACASPFTTTPLADGSHTVAVRAIDPATNVDPSPASQTFAVDATPPETTIDSGPSGSTNDRTPTFGFSSNEPGSTFQCAVDGGGFAGCSSPFTTAALANGAHSFQVRATDAAGNVDATPASRSFRVPSDACTKAKRALKKAKKKLKAAKTAAQKKKAKAAVKKARKKVKKYC